MAVTQKSYYRLSQTSSKSHLFVIPHTTVYNIQPRPTAIFCANDDMAAECVAAAREAGLGIPDDLSVAGYGDTAAGHLLDITTVHQDPVSMGKRAAERLLERLDAPDCPPANISLPVQLVVRGSTAAPAALTARSVP